MYEIVGFQNFVDKDSGLLMGHKVYLKEFGFSTVAEGYGVVSYYFAKEKVQGSLSVGAVCDILFVQSSKGAFPGALIIR